MLLTVEVADRVDLFDLKGKDRKTFGKIKFRMATIFRGDGEFAEKWYFASDIFNYLNITNKDGFDAISYSNRNHILVFTKNNSLQEVQVIDRAAITELDDYLDNDKTYNLIDFLDYYMNDYDESDNRALYELPRVNYVK